MAGLQAERSPVMVPTSSWPFAQTTVPGRPATRRTGLMVIGVLVVVCIALGISFVIWRSRRRRQVRLELILQLHLTTCQPPTGCHTLAYTDLETFSSDTLDIAAYRLPKASQGISVRSPGLRKASCMCADSCICHPCMCYVMPGLAAMPLHRCNILLSSPGATWR